MGCWGFPVLKCLRCSLSISVQLGAGKKNEVCSVFYLICKKHHDGVTARARGHVLDSEGVVVIFNDVKIYICLCWTHHTWGTFDPNADIT